MLENSEVPAAAGLDAAVAVARAGVHVPAEVELTLPHGFARTTCTQTSHYQHPPEPI